MPAGPQESEGYQVSTAEYVMVQSRCHPCSGPLLSVFCLPLWALSLKARTSLYIFVFPVPNTSSNTWLKRCSINVCCIYLSCWFLFPQLEYRHWNSESVGARASGDSYRNLALAFTPIPWGNQVAQPYTTLLCYTGLVEENFSKRRRQGMEFIHPRSIYWASIVCPTQVKVLGKERWKEHRPWP